MLHARSTRAQVVRTSHLQVCFFIYTMCRLPHIKYYVYVHDTTYIYSSRIDHDMPQTVHCKTVTVTSASVSPLCSPFIEPRHCQADINTLVSQVITQFIPALSNTHKSVVSNL